MWTFSLLMIHIPFGPSSDWWKTYNKLFVALVSQQWTKKIIALSLDLGLLNINHYWICRLSSYLLLPIFFLYFYSSNVRVLLYLKNTILKFEYFKFPNSLPKSIEMSTFFGACGGNHQTPKLTNITNFWNMLSTTLLYPKLIYMD